jgi:hypothetical protein
MDHAAHDPSREDPTGSDENVPGHRSGHGAGGLWEQIHRDEQRRENADAETDDSADRSQPQQRSGPG